METIRTIAWMKEKAREARLEQRVIGLVPTMGALHAGHIALVERAKRECSLVYASIFLNPTQFGPKEDLAKYPRPLAADIEKLEAAKADGLFLPEAGDIYPAGFSTYVHVEGLSEKLEGRSRPGHFRGVATVVMKLLEIVQPQFAYFGRKDALQLQTAMRKALGGEPLARVDYAEIADADTFEPVVRVTRRCYVLLAVRIGRTRLIDNLLLEPEGEDLRAEL